MEKPAENVDETNEFLKDNKLLFSTTEKYNQTKIVMVVGNVLLTIAIMVSYMIHDSVPLLIILILSICFTGTAEKVLMNSIEQHDIAVKRTAELKKEYYEKGKERSEERRNRNIELRKELENGQDIMASEIKESEYRMTKKDENYKRVIG